MLRRVIGVQTGDRFLVALGTMFAAAFFCCGLAGLAAAGALGGVGTWLLSDSGQWAILGMVSAAMAWAIFGGPPRKRQKTNAEIS